MNHQKLNVLLVVGGDSSERDVSLDTGKSVHDALVALGHRVVVADPGRGNIAPSDDPDAFFADVSIKGEPPGRLDDVYASRKSFLQVLQRYHELRCEVVFNALHGGAGEDGTFQAVLDYMGIRYTGSGACASAVAMNKNMSKQLATRACVPVAKQVFVDTPAHESVVIDDEVMKTLSLPVVVKPNEEGSSVGVTIVRSKSELSKAIADAKALGGPFLVETFVPGKEITASVLDFCDLPLIEIDPKSGFFDYHNKYQPGSCDYLVPAPLDEETTTSVLASTHAVYRALGCRGYARIDFRVGEDGGHYFLEANTLPGLTAQSLVPKAAKAAGIDYTELIDRILRLSLLRNRV